MSKVNTTLGERNTADLGAVNVHEHVIIDGRENPYIPEDFNHVETDPIASELIAWKDAGGGAIIDSSPIGVGRNVQLLEKTSRAANLPLIIASGFHKLAYYPKSHWLHSASENQIHALLVDECTKGVMSDDHQQTLSQRSQIKAGILKIGVDANGVTPVLSKIIAAVANTMAETTVNCMVHTEPNVPFDDVLRHLDDHQLPPHRIMFCHMGKSLDPQLHLLLAKKGFYLEFDEMIRSRPPLPELAQAIHDLFDSGYGHSVLFAGDLARRSYWACFGGKPGLRYLISGLSDELQKLGFTEEMLASIWVKNPQRFLSGD